MARIDGASDIFMTRLLNLTKGAPTTSKEIVPQMENGKREQVELVWIHNDYELLSNTCHKRFLGKGKIRKASFACVYDSNGVLERA